MRAFLMMALMAAGIASAAADEVAAPSELDLTKPATWPVAADPIAREQCMHHRADDLKRLCIMATSVQKPLVPAKK